MLKKILFLIEKRFYQQTISILLYIFSFICLIMLLSQLSFFLAKDIPPQNSNPSTINNPPPKDDFFRGLPKESPFMLTFFVLGFIINLFGGLIINLNLLKKEKKEIKSSVVNEMLLPEEKILIKLLEDNNGELTQKELVKKSGLNKLKVSRVIKRLHSINIIEKFPYGMTNNIKLKTDIN